MKTTNTVIKIVVSILFILIGSMSIVKAQNDTMYVLKDNLIMQKVSIKAADVDSVVFFKPQLPNNGTFTDIRDGNVYKWVKIGNRIWMAENLRYLPSVVGPSTGSQTIPYQYVYGYNGTDVNAAKATANYITYGVLYNWSAAMAGSEGCTSANPSIIKGIAPTGWHIPNHAEWAQLVNFVGDSNTAGGKLKETGTVHWTSPNIGATNEVNFNALPGGDRYSGGGFLNIGNQGFWWSSTQDNATVYLRTLYSSYSKIDTAGDNGESGFSIRCVKD